MKKIHFISPISLTFFIYAQSSVAICNNQIKASTPSDRFTQNSGIIYDKKTALEWQSCSGANPEWLNGQCVSTPQAITWWQALSLASQQENGWRLPNKKELASIVEYQCSQPALNSEIFPEREAASEFYWTSTPVTYSDAARAWSVDFATGAFLIRPVDELAFVRWVRERN